MNNISPLELLGGREFYLKLEQADLALLEIEKKYSIYFQNQPKIVGTNEENKRLHDYWVMTYNSDSRKFLFAFRNDSDLPNYIRDECLMVIKTIFDNIEENIGHPPS